MYNYTFNILIIQQLYLTGGTYSCGINSALYSIFRKYIQEVDYIYKKHDRE